MTQSDHTDDRSSIPAATSVRALQEDAGTTATSLFTPPLGVPTDGRLPAGRKAFAAAEGAHGAEGRDLQALMLDPATAISDRRALILMSVRDVSDRPATVTEIFNGIVIDLVEGRLLPGDSLNSVDLARRFGTSRTPVRDALSVLERLGVIVVPAHRRPYATPFTLRQVKNLYDLRASLFALVAESIIENCPSDQLAVLWKWQSALERDVAEGSVDNYFWHNVGFRLVEVQLTGNEELQRSISALGVRTLQLRHLSLSQPGRLQRSVEDHRRLLVAYADRDKATAVSMTRALIMAGYHTIERSTIFSASASATMADAVEMTGPLVERPGEQASIDMPWGEMHYRKWGAGTPLLMLHPLAMAGAMWEPIVNDLAARHQVIAPDLRGHGKSSWDGQPFTIEDLADDVERLLDALGIERCHMLGMSMGGTVASVFAAAHPRRVDHLVLCDTTGWYGPDAAAKWAERARTATQVSRENQIPFQTDRWFNERFRKSSPAVVAHVVDVFLRTNSKVHAQACFALGAFDARDRLKDIAAPTFVVTGEEDYATPPSMGSALANAIPRARFQVWPALRHMALMESAELRAEILRQLSS